VRIEFGNESTKGQQIGDGPKITSLFIPEYDDGSTHPDAQYDGRHPCEDGDGPVGTLIKPGPRLGGYTHKVGAISVEDFTKHVEDTGALVKIRGLHQPILLEGQPYPITRLPDSEILLSAVHSYPMHATAPPTWIKAYEGESPKVTADVEQFLARFYDCPTGDEYFGTSDPDELLVKKELTHWTRTPPGELPAGLALPDAKALFTNVGRTLQANSFGGGQVGVVGTGTAATSTSFTTNQTLTTNAWAGYRVYAYNGTNLIWGNVISNTNAAGASVLTIDRWYVAATPGGAAATTPASGYYFILADGGSISNWFVGLTVTNITPAATNTSLSGEYTTASGGYLRKIAPYALTSGTSPMTYTLTPVYTGNGSDTYPSTFYAIGVFNSMVTGDTTDTMPFQTSLNASATVAASGDQVTITETTSGS
jgi:hypothetical protein